MIAQNVQNIVEKIDFCCKKYNRNISDVKLIAVSKNFKVEDVKEAIDATMTDFGENKAQELDKKFGVLGNIVKWHFIGHLQVNKAKFAVKAADIIHSVDSLKLAEEINKRASSIGKIQQILLEIKTSDEDTKFGLKDVDSIYRLAEYCSGSANLKLLGLMTVAPFTDDTDVIKKSFSGLRELKDKLNDKGFGLTELSMGMSNDFEIAIQEGSTMLRIGTAIFGERNYN